MLDVIAELIKMTLRQGSQINLLAAHLSEQSCLIEPTLSRCESCKKEPLTLEHRKLHVKLCDRCASETIVKAAHAFLMLCKQNPRDPFLSIASSLMDEDSWAEVDDAERIRRITEYARASQELDVRQDRVH